MLTDLIKIHGMNYTVIRITFGGKAYHFSTKKENAIKAITKANFHSLPDSSKVFMIFTMARLIVGKMNLFLFAAKHNKANCQFSIGYCMKSVDWFAEQNQTKNHSLFFFNKRLRQFITKNTPQR